MAAAVSLAGQTLGAGQDFVPGAETSPSRVNMQGFEKVRLHL